jgi:cell pole-organizing protein PopZ
MSESGGASEPSMEDILASIRRILNEDGEPAGEGEGSPEPAETSRAAVAIPPAQAAVDDIFELDQSMIVPEPEPPAALAAPPPRNETPAAMPPLAEDEPLLDEAAAAAASASLGALVRVMGQQRHIPVYQGGPTLEDLVRQELRPLMKAWLDEYLPPMVERLVRAEIDRVSNSRI